MPQRKTSGSWGERPSTKKPVAEVRSSDLDRFVSGHKNDAVRLNVQIPRSLRSRVKVGCAREGREIKDVVVELLEQRFPE